MRLLVAPVTITPTKPLVPTHVKGFLWVDLLCKATGMNTEVTCLWNPRTPNLTGQAIRFWEYLDRTHDNVDYARLDEFDIGVLYMRYHAEGAPVDQLVIQKYVDRIETDGWVHPATSRMLDLWSGQLGVLGVADPGFRRDREYAYSVDGLVDRLAAERLCLDYRDIGGPLYLDATRWGIPLRTGISADGHVNYLIMALRDMLPVLDRHDHVLLVYDEEIGPDFILLEKVLRHFGASTSRLALGRVPVAGVVRSSRHGGWDGATLGDLTDAALARFSVEEYRLGMRVYFTAMLGRTRGVSLDQAMLYRAMLKARRLLDHSPSGCGGSVELLKYCSGKSAWIDPYRLTAAVLGGQIPVRLLGDVYL
jgi:hypothetical protein